VDWADRLKPAAAVRTQLLLAWMMWTVVGTALISVGFRWTWDGEATMAPWIAAVAVAVGGFKSRLVLDRAAQRVVDRIRARGDGRCLGGFLSLGTWGLVVFMMVGGRVLRVTLARGVTGPLYIAVGTALCLSSRQTWQAWRSSRHAP
jgi:hypothetical protein